MAPAGLFFFGPVFAAFGSEVCKQLHRSNHLERLHAIVSGPPRVKREVLAGLPFAPSSVWDLSAVEHTWQQKAPDSSFRDVLDSMAAELGSGTAGRTMASDRRVGGGLVTGTRPRPSRLLHHARKNPLWFPSQYVAELYQWLTKILDEAKPDYVFLYAIAGAPAYLLSQLSLERHVPTIRPKMIGIEDRWKIELLHRQRNGSIGSRMPPNMSDFVHPQNNSIVRDSIDEVAYQAISRIREGSSRPAPSLTEESLSTNLASQAARRVVEAAKRARVSAFESPLVSDQGLSIRAQRLGHDLMNMVRSSLARSDNIDWAISTDRPLVLFPLHVDPEAATMVRAPQFTDQKYVLSVIAKSLNGSELIVAKEHPAMPSRPKNFYHEIRKMPNVVYGSSSIPNSVWLGKASVVVTIAGTVSLEATVFQKPLVVLGQPHDVTEQCGGFVHAPDPSTWASSIERSIYCRQPSDSDIHTNIVREVKQSFSLPLAIAESHDLNDVRDVDIERGAECYVQGIASLLTAVGIAPGAV